MAVVVACATAAVVTRLIVDREADRTSAERARAAAAMVRAEVLRASREMEGLVSLRRATRAGFDTLAAATVGAAGAAFAVDVRRTKGDEYHVVNTAIGTHSHRVEEFSPELLATLRSPAARYGVVASAPTREHDVGPGVWFVAGSASQRLDGPEHVFAAFVRAERLLGRAEGHPEPAVLYVGRKMVAGTQDAPGDRVRRDFNVAGVRWTVATEKRSPSAAATALPWTIAGTGLAIAWLVVVVTGRIESVRRHEIALMHQREASRALAAEAALEERQRIARDLHDSVSQRLFSMTLHAQAAQLGMSQEGIPRDGVAARAVRHLAELTRDALSDLRQLIFAMRPPALAEDGLVPALRRHADALAVREGIAIAVRGPGEPLALDPVSEEHLYRVSLEAIQNAVKHARAKRLDVELDVAREGEEELLTLSVRDDGVGFDLGASHPGHLGLDTMRERVAELGGVLGMDSAVGEGTTVTVTLSLDRELESQPA